MPDASVSQIINQLGMAGLVIVLTLRLVFDFLSKRRDNGNGNGNGSSDSKQTQLWEFKIKEIVGQQVKEGLTPLAEELKETNKILRDIEQNTAATINILRFQRGGDKSHGAHA